MDEVNIFRIGYEEVKYEKPRVVYKLTDDDFTIDTKGNLSLETNTVKVDGNLIIYADSVNFGSCTVEITGNLEVYQPPTYGGAGTMTVEGEIRDER